MEFSLIFVSCVISSFILTPIVRKIAISLNVLDHPNERKIHTKPTPLLGGLAVAIPFLIIFWVFKDSFGRSADNLFLGSIVILIFGFLDDRFKLSAKLRLAIQLLVAVFLIAGSLSIEIFPKTGLGLILRYVITIIWVIGITNAMNYLDGMDGLCAGLSFISSCCFAVIAFFTGQPIVFVLSLSLAGCCLGFLPYNLPTAKIFLGDTGSTFLGFMLAGIGLLGVWAEDNIVKIGIPVLILGVPIFDMAFTTIMRIKEGKVHTFKQWLEYAGKDHFHHRLVDLGLRKKGTVVFIYLVGIVLGISALALLRAGWKTAILLIVQAATVFAMIAVLMIVGAMRQSGWEKDKGN